MGGKKRPSCTVTTDPEGSAPGLRSPSSSPHRPSSSAAHLWSQASPGMSTQTSLLKELSARNLETIGCICDPALCSWARAGWTSTPWRWGCPPLEMGMPIALLLEMGMLGAFPRLPARSCPQGRGEQPPPSHSPLSFVSWQGCWASAHLWQRFLENRSNQAGAPVRRPQPWFQWGRGLPPHLPP